MFLFPWLDWGIDIVDFEKTIVEVMSDFGVFPAPGQTDFEQQRHLRRWAGNFQKVWVEKILGETFLGKLLSCRSEIEFLEKKSENRDANLHRPFH